MENRSCNNDQMTLRASFYAIFLCMLFGGNAVAIKFSLSGVGAFTAAGLRFGISAFVIYIWATFKKQPLRINKKQAMQLFILSQFFIMQSTFLYLGLTKTTASHGVLIINLLPFFVMVMAHFFIPGDHITLKKVLGLICGFLGVVLIFFDNHGLSHDLIIGDLMILFTAFFWGCNIIYAKRIINNFNVIQITWYPMIISTPLFFLGGYLWDSQMVKTLNSTIINALLYQSVIAAAFGFIAWNNLLQKFGATALHSFVFLMPLSGVFFSVVLLGESLSIYLILSIMMIISGLFIVNIKFG
ncbi:MAG: DMT family transporter [Proteobacteria bacterium]|nr:DMT family transporter [Desulfobacula sp.]MBU4130073.1 DMT family transporter [Pseudomonadota bacterium]